MFPVRCFTCNSLIGHKYNEYMTRKDQSGFYGKLLNDLGVHKFCCRRMFLTHVDVVEDICIYSAKNVIMDESQTEFNAFVKKERDVKCV